eukprot:1626267-Prymnesium_polylepis.1
MHRALAAQLDARTLHGYGRARHAAAGGPVEDSLPAAGDGRGNTDVGAGHAHATDRRARMRRATRRGAG